MLEISGVLYADRKDSLEITYLNDVVYAHRKNRDLCLQLLIPGEPDWKEREEKLQDDDPKKRFRCFQKKDSRRFPLIVEAAGSGWSGAEGYKHLPRTVFLAQAGYVVACICAGIAYNV